ncbi:MAG: YebC/PmpR family DNA-binding transcriptional regulator [Victivallaceae bacterium]
MAGHSKWANIKHRKERADNKKSKIFSRIIKEMISAVKNGGSDVKSNPRLRMVVQKAKAHNIPNDNIERNIKKAGSVDQKAFEAVVYELYGYGGVGIIVEALTDNKNRTASDIRIAVNKRGGTLVEPGSVLYTFARKGVCYVDSESIEEDALLKEIIEAGAEDLIQDEDGRFMVITEPHLLFEVKEKLEAENVKIVEEELTYLPLRQVDCNEEEGKANIALIEWLEDIDDIDVVHHNMA